MTQKSDLISDSELLRLLAQDGERGMALIFRQHYADLCRCVARILPPEGGAVEDIAQEVFHDIWKKRDALQVTTSLKAYLRRAGVNKSLNHLRDRKIRWDDEEQLPLLRSPLPDASQQLEGEDLQRLLEATIDRLPERCRLVFSLSRFEEMTYQEIAGHLGISIKTVENQMTKALRLLRQALEK